MLIGAGVEALMQSHISMHLKRRNKAAAFLLPTVSSTGTAETALWPPHAGLCNSWRLQSRCRNEAFSLFITFLKKRGRYFRWHTVLF